MCFRNKEYNFMITYNDLFKTLYDSKITMEQYMQNREKIYLLETQISTSCTKEEIKIIYENLCKKYTNVKVFKIGRFIWLSTINFMPKEILLKGEQ